MDKSSLVWLSHNKPSLAQQQPEWAILSATYQKTKQNNDLFMNRQKTLNTVEMDFSRVSLASDTFLHN